MKRYYWTLLLLASLSVFVFGANAEINDGLVAFYPFNGNANDESGNGYDGTVYGATLTTDRFGNPDRAYSFDGTDYISAPDSNVFPVSSTPFTLAAWVALDSYGPDGGCYLMGQSDGGGNYNKWIFWLGSGGISFISYPSSGSHWIGLGSFSFQLNTWYHVAVRSDGSTLVSFVNGTQLGSASARDIGDASSPFYMGTAEGTTRRLRGSVDDVRIYNRALSESEINDLFTLNDSSQKVVYITNKGIGVGENNPQAEVDIAGLLRIEKQASEPEACNSLNEGALSLTQDYKLCICIDGMGWQEYGFYPSDAPCDW